MKFLKGLFIFLLLVVIFGGVGFLVYSIFGGNMSGMNMSSASNQNTAGNDNMTDVNESSTNNVNQNAKLPNPIDAQNREKMSKAINLINEAMDLITIDPYSSTTVPDYSTTRNNAQTEQGSGTINIYPSGSSSVNIVPENSSQNTSQNAGSTNVVQNTAGSISAMNNIQMNNFVYDQGKLQQLHSGIYTIAQGILAVNDLNESLLAQSMNLEQQPITYQSYVTRFNNASVNKSDLENAIAMLDYTTVLININPYASNLGYAYDSSNMKKLHDGIYKFAQGMAILQSLDKDFTNQMASASASAQNLVANSSQMIMSGNGMNLFGNLSLSTILNFILIVLVIGLFIGIIGAVGSMFKRRPADSSSNNL